MYTNINQLRTNNLPTCNPATPLLNAHKFNNPACRSIVSKSQIKLTSQSLLASQPAIQGLRAARSNGLQAHSMRHAFGWPTLFSLKLSNSVAAQNEQAHCALRKKVAVIAGGTRGIGQGLAKAFADMHVNVMITGQSEKSVNNALQILNASNLQTPIHGKICDIRRLDDIQAVWDKTIEQFGRVDYWITCAGIIQSPSEKQGLKRLVDMRGKGLKDVIDVNLTGAMNCASVVVPAMEKQGNGSFYLFEGFGSDGTIRTGFAAYGASKVAIQYLTKALAQENSQAKSPVNIGSLAPGIVITDLLKKSYTPDSAEWKKDKVIYDILADEVTPVAEFLAKEVTKNETNGRTITWLTPAKAAARFLTAPFHRRQDITLD